MNDLTVRVRPMGGAWVVEGPDELEPMLFLSGARAEAQARSIARSITSSGNAASVAIHDLTDAVVGTIQYGSPAHGFGPLRSPPEVRT